MQEQISGFLEIAEVEKSVLQNSLAKMKMVMDTMKKIERSKSPEQKISFCNQIEVELREIKREELRVEWEEDELLKKLYEIKRTIKP